MTRRCVSQHGTRASTPARRVGVLLLVDGKQLAALLRIKSLWRQRCCALPVCGFGEGGRPAASNKKRGRQAEQVKAVERPRIQKMTQTSVLRLGAPGTSVERTSDNPTSVLSAAGTRRRSRGSRQA